MSSKIWVGVAMTVHFYVRNLKSKQKCESMFVVVLECPYILYGYWRNDLENWYLEVAYVCREDSIRNVGLFCLQLYNG